MRAYVCFLEREVYAFLSTLDKRGERVRGDSCGPAFFVYGRAAESDVGGAGDGPAAGGTREELVGRATQEERHAKARGKKERELFSFS